MIHHLCIKPDEAKNIINLLKLRAPERFGKRPPSDLVGCANKEGRAEINVQVRVNGYYEEDSSLEISSVTFCGVDILPAISDENIKQILKDESPKA